MIRQKRTHGFRIIDDSQRLHNSRATNNLRRLHNSRIAHTNRSHSRDGFTLIEVSLATALLSVLLITIAIITNQIITIYQKGTVMKNLNSVGRIITDDFQSAINAALPADTIDRSKFDNEYYKHPDGDLGTGVFCSGQYSYIWADVNHQGDNRVRLEYNISGTSATQRVDNIRLLKIKDPRRQVCIDYNKNNPRAVDITSETAKSKSPGLTTDYTISDQPEELLYGNEVNFYIYSLIVNPVNSATSTNQSPDQKTEVFFSGSFILGTERGVDINSSNCSVGAEGVDFNYCAINTFKFAARTAGKVGK